MQSEVDYLCQSQTPFCLIQKQDNDEILLLKGHASKYSSLGEIPRKKGRTSKCDVPVFESISVVPFCQIRERGYRAVESGERILTIEIAHQSMLEFHSFLNCLPEIAVKLNSPILYDTTANQYKEIVESVINNEIGMGEGANFVIPRNGEGQFEQFTTAHALSIFKNLLQKDYGTYWKFIFFDGETYFIGSTPERHLQVEGNNVRMNPISGTFRKDRKWKNRAEVKRSLLRFLKDQKEINELFMVVDEELKMMAKMCDQGGTIIGPLLKEMSALIHSEYILSGQSSKDVLELFKDSMFAATVVGSPVENGCNIIEKYCSRSRRYYGSALLLLGKDKNGDDYLDSPITIRTFEISQHGRLHFSVGATLVKDSIPDEELQETFAKSKAILSSLTTQCSQKNPRLLTNLYNDDDIAETLVKRNQNLSTFWFFKQHPHEKSHYRQNRPTITLIHNEDDFIYMLQHIFNSMGIKTKIIRYDRYQIQQDTSDLTLLGPGPGNPMNITDRKISINYSIAADLLQKRKRALFICLGHQILCSTIGLELKKKKCPLQGSQMEIDLFGKKELVGFYNTFAPVAPNRVEEAELSILPEENELIAIRSKHYIGFQFHPESILTKNGLAILEESISHLLD